MRIRIIETTWKEMCGKCRKQYVKKCINDINGNPASKGMSYGQLAKKYGIPKATLYDHRDKINHAKS